MDKGFKQLHGIRVMLSLPNREKSLVPLLPETQKEVDREFWEKSEKMEVYAVGENVQGISVGDKVYLPVDELRRAVYIEIDGGMKVIVPQIAIALTW